jgi:YVTN family beta-propeller protein
VGHECGHGPPVTGLVYIANTGSHTVSVIDGWTNIVTHTIPVAMTRRTSRDSGFIWPTGSR